MRLDLVDDRIGADVARHLEQSRADVAADRFDDEHDVLAAHDAERPFDHAPRGVRQVVVNRSEAKRWERDPAGGTRWSVSAARGAVEARRTHRAARDGARRCRGRGATLDGARWLGGGGRWLDGGGRWLGGTMRWLGAGVVGLCSGGSDGRFESPPGINDSHGEFLAIREDGASALRAARSAPVHGVGPVGAGVFGFAVGFVVHGGVVCVLRLGRVASVARIARRLCVVRVGRGSSVARVLDRWPRIVPASVATGGPSVAESPEESGLEGDAESVAAVPVSGEPPPPLSSLTLPSS